MAQKRKVAAFHQKVHFCYKVSSCENRQQQSCKAFTSLSIRAEMVGGGRPLLRENSAEIDPPFKSADFQSIFACSASAVTTTEKTEKKVQLTRIGSPLRAFQ